MLRSILIGLDGSTEGEAAVEQGLSWAKAHDALAVGFSIVDESGILVAEQALFAAGYYKPTEEPRINVARQRCREILEQFKGRCHDHQVQFKALSQSGMPYHRLLEEAQRCDLVVLGQKTHFEYGWEDQPDETLARVLKDSPRPVVAVPKSAKVGDVVIVAYDGSLQASRALYAFVLSGLIRTSTVHVMSVAPILAEATCHVNRAVDYLRTHDINVVGLPLESHGKPAEVILEEASRHNTGLMVMGAYGKPTIREFFVGSVTRTLLENSPVAVFCYH